MPKKINEKVLPKEGEETPEMTPELKRLIIKSNNAEKNVSAGTRLPINTTDDEYIAFLERFRRD